jgi:hypothetical protein
VRYDDERESSDARKPKAEYGDGATVLRRRTKTHGLLRKTDGKRLKDAAAAAVAASAVIG